MASPAFMSSIKALAPRMQIKYSKPIIDNLVFKLHYKLTVTMLLCFVILVSGREYFGEHIKCLSDQGVPPHVIQTYCFFMATFTIIRHYNQSLLEGGLLPHPGIGPDLEEDEPIRHTYYQWVPFVLFIQSLLFYLPHYIWKRQEGGRIKALVEGLKYSSLALHDADVQAGDISVPSKTTIKRKVQLIKKDIILRLQITRSWSYWLVTMEVANLMHIIFEVWLSNVFLHGCYIGLGFNVLSFSGWGDISNPLETIFPKVTKCVFHKYGPSGSIQQHDALCVMALNIIHEKIYVILWFWFLFLFIVSFIAILWRLISYFMYRRSLKFNEAVFHHITRKKLNPCNVVNIVNCCKYGDWLFLSYLAKNLQSATYQELFRSISEEFEKGHDVLTYSHGGAIKQTDDLIEVNYANETLPH
ncbi:innexin inx7 [Pieris rapae]|uniref:innexin inx7 n=1 Tax=Pieris rapae TaxID=64459 RepID=UPI001E27C482|nr:innexin inx7 [Pieris rapae]